MPDYKAMLIEAMREINVYGTGGTAASRQRLYGWVVAKLNDPNWGEVMAASEVDEENHA